MNTKLFSISVVLYEKWYSWIYIRGFSDYWNLGPYDTEEEALSASKRHCINELWKLYLGELGALQ